MGAERSGTTLLRLMLDHHPQIAMPHQLEFVVDRVGDDGSFPDLASYRAYLDDSPVFQRSGFTVDPKLRYPELVNDFLQQRRGGCPIFGGSVHRHLDRLVRSWPEARLIHIVRDPRAVARSVIGMGWASNGWCAVANWIEFEESWDRLRERLPRDRCCEVRYERMVEGPWAELGRVCDFLGVAPDEAMLAYPDDSRYEPPDPRLSDQWRAVLSANEQRRIEARVGGLLEQRRYAASGLPPIAIGPLGEAWLRAHDRVGRARFRLRRYGWRLYASQFVSRRLGTNRWRRRVAGRVRAVDSRHVR